MDYLSTMNIFDSARELVRKAGDVKTGENNWGLENFEPNQTP